MRFAGMGIKMAIIIGLGVYLGRMIDLKFENETPIWTIVLSLLFIGVAFWQVIKDVSK